MIMRKAYVVIVLLMNLCVYSMDNQQDNGAVLSVLKDVATTLLGISNVVYGAWNGIVYGAQWALPSREESHKPKINMVLKDVLFPISTGTLMLLSRSRCSSKV